MIINPSQHTRRYLSANALLADCHPPQGYHIDSDDISNILGIGWSSPWNIWHSILSYQQDPQIYQQQRDRTKWAPVIRRLYEAETQRSIDFEWRRITHMEHRWATAIVLGLSKDPSSGTTGALCFYICTDPDAWGTGNDIIESWGSQSAQILPPNIATEAYWTIEVAGVDWVDVVVASSSWSDLIRLNITRVMPDPTMQAGIMRAASAWRERHLLEQSPPKIDHSRICSSYLMERYKHSTGTIRDASDEEKELLDAYDALGNQIRELQSQHKLMRNQMLNSVGYDRGIESNDGARAIVSRGTRGLQLRTSRKKVASS